MYNRSTKKKDFNKGNNKYLQHLAVHSLDKTLAYDIFRAVLSFPINKLLENLL